jgi:hypothetical protein
VAVNPKICRRIAPQNTLCSDSDQVPQHGEMTRSAIVGRRFGSRHLDCPTFQRTELVALLYPRFKNRGANTSTPASSCSMLLMTFCSELAKLSDESVSAGKKTGDIIHRSNAAERASGYRGVAENIKRATISGVVAAIGLNPDDINNYPVVC